MRCVYGPIASWRLGKSLGVDLICQHEKICTFDCIYCQLEDSDKITSKQEEFVLLTKVEQELKNALEKKTPDILTFSGMGEPTLATNMDEAITLIRNLTSLPIAILTNSSLFYRNGVADTVRKIDHIVSKLDAPNEKLFQQISRPAEGISFENTLKGIKTVRETCQGKFSLQIMFMEQNKTYAPDLAELAREINPDEVQINTPTRFCKINPLSKNELQQIEKHFNGLNTLNVYTSTRPTTDPLDKRELIRRRRFEP